MAKALVSQGLNLLRQLNDCLGPRVSIYNIGGMTGRSISTGDSGLQANVLDHSREFVELVYRRAPGEYRALLESERFSGELEQSNNFNFGKLYAYAEFIVFRREFRARFPDASGPSCINTFSSLFLKNDISMTNLVAYMEGTGDREQLFLNQPR
jgi:hypothetical protein